MILALALASFGLNVPLKSVERKDVNRNRNPSFIARRQQHHDFSARTTIGINPKTSDNEASLAALYHNTNYLFLGVRIKDGKAQEIFLEQHHAKSTAAETVATASLPAAAWEIELRLEGEGRSYDFSYRMEGGNWTSLKAKVDGSLLARERLDNAGHALQAQVAASSRARVAWLLL